MEGETEQNDNTTSRNDTSWSATTNWTIADGSLVNSITFESTLSPTTDDNGNRNSAENSTPQSPLVLCPPSTDQTPCEISINFARKVEVQQVYVRSTARVYEIYYASDLKSSNDYLCTVHCGVATRDEEVLHTPDIGEVTLMNQKGDCKGSDEKKPKRESSLSTNEDGWVEVKAFDSPRLDNGNSNSGTKTEGSMMDFYEATAQITDADPCMSITLRLLSLQNKGCVFVDEIYMFGDPVEPAESENVTSRTETDGSSLMAMFVPTLLQLSEARSVCRIQDDHILDAKEREMKEFSSQTPYLTNSANKIHREENSGLADKQKVKLQETVGSVAIASQVEKLGIPSQVSDGERKLDLPCSHNEKVLDHLVSRVSRIEDLLLRFEERMLKPLNSIEARLQHVEQQLEELNKKPQNSDLQCCTRIYAPEFSCHELDDFFDSNENNMPTSDEMGSPLCIPPEHGVDLANASHSLSSLVVTAPEFSHADEEEEDELEAVADSSKEEPKRALSIDDALASALAGLMSSTSAERQKYTQALAIKAPDFSFEEDSNSGKRAMQETKDGIATDPPFNHTVTDETECIISASTSSNIHFLESKLKEIKSFNDHYLENTGEGVDEKFWFNEEGKDSQASDIQDAIASAGQVVTKTNLHKITEDIEGLEASNRFSNISALGYCEAVDQFLDNQIDGGSDLIQEITFANFEFSTTAEVKDEDCEKVILQDIFYFPSASSIVDFEIPVLDVNFVSQDISPSASLLEALLADLPDSNDEVPCATEQDDVSQVGEQCDLISVDDYKSIIPTNANYFSVDVDYCSLGEIPLTVEDEGLQEYYTSNGGECEVGLI